MKFLYGPQPGFDVDRVILRADKSAIVLVSSAVDKTDAEILKKPKKNVPMHFERVDLEVHVDTTANPTHAQIRSAALNRAAAIMEAAVKSIKKKTGPALKPRKTLN